MTILRDDVIDLTEQLCAIDSISGNEGDLVDLVARGLEETGWHVHRQKVYDDGKGRDNVYATRQPIGEHVPRLIFNSHFDTVPPLIPLKRTSTAIFGRGVNEAKGQMACLIVAANKLVKEHPEISKDIALLFVVGEEIDHAGMIKSNDLRGYAPEYLIVGEPTEMKYAAIQKGALKVKLRVDGKAGHSGYPHAGESAVHKLVVILNDIMTYDWPKDDKLGDTTFNIGVINGGQALNAWAEKAEAGVSYTLHSYTTLSSFTFSEYEIKVYKYHYCQIFFRVTTSYADLKKRIEDVVAGRAHLDYSLGGNDPVQLSLPPFEAPSGQASFNTDMPYFANLDKLKGSFLYGAGSITKAFGPDEFVLFTELRECVDSHVRLASSLLQK